MSDSTRVCRMTAGDTGGIHFQHVANDSLLSFYQHVCMGYVEVHKTENAGTVWVADSGVQNAEVNFIASALTGKVLRGDAVVTGPANSDGEETDILDIDVLSIMSFWMTGMRR